MPAQGQKPALPHRSIAVRFTSIKQTPTGALASSSRSRRISFLQGSGCFALVKKDAAGSGSIAKSINSPNASAIAAGYIVNALARYKVLFRDGGRTKIALLRLQIPTIFHQSLKEMASEVDQPMVTVAP
jgi:hypothetical protein